MQEESGFFTSAYLKDDAASGVTGRDSYHDFRLLYTSRQGFCQLLLAHRHGRLFAVKTLRDGYRGNKAAEVALRKEYDAGVMVDSSFVARTYDFISFPDYGNSIILEYCPGETLRNLIDTDITLTVSETDEIVRGIAKALADIHAAGLIHRDIKPSNIIYSGQTGSLKVIDMGCADSNGFNILHEPAGTERYTPPGRTAAGSRTDTRNDLYSMGMVLSELRQIASPCRRKVLTLLSSSLIKGDITNAGRAYASYCRLVSRHRLKKRLKLIVPAIMATASGIIFVSGYIADGHKQYEGEADTKGAKPDSAILADEALRSPASLQDYSAGENTLSPTVSLVKDTLQSHVSSISGKDEEQTDDRQFMIPGVAIPPDELEKNRYGVAMAEAKYLAIFKRNEFDYYVVRETDNVMIEAVRDAPDKLRAYREQSEDKTAEAVLAKVRAKYPDADLRRARGLVSQRWLLLHCLYRIENPQIQKSAGGT